MTLAERPAVAHTRTAGVHPLARYTWQDARDVAMIYLAGGMTSSRAFAAAADPEHIRIVRTGEGLPAVLRPSGPAPDDGSTERMCLMIAEAMRELEAEGFDAAAYMREIQRKLGRAAS